MLAELKNEWDRREAELKTEVEDNKRAAEQKKKKMENELAYDKWRKS